MNIISAPQSPPGLPGVVCSFHHRIHEWRIIDLEHVVETNGKSSTIRAWCLGWIERILDNIPHGFYYDPEDM